jgi:hypothetical protein
MGQRMLKKLALALIAACLITSAAFAQPATTRPNISGLLTQCAANAPIVGNGAGNQPICGTGGFSPAPISNSLAATVTLTGLSNFLTGPTVAQGTIGTWFVSGTVTLESSAATQAAFCKLWDGTTVIASVPVNLTVSGDVYPVSLSGFLASPAGNLNIACSGTAGASIVTNVTGLGKDSTITAHRIQ